MSRKWGQDPRHVQRQRARTAQRNQRHASHQDPHVPGFGSHPAAMQGIGVGSGLGIVIMIIMANQGVAAVTLSYVVILLGIVAVPVTILLAYRKSRRLLAEQPYHNS